jgi:peroxiredoxin Q/BCP
LIGHVGGDRDTFERRTYNFMKLNIQLRVILTVTAAALLAATLAFAAAVPAEGSKAPAFSLPSQEGKQVALKDFAGKWVVLYFYPKDMTPGCTIEAHNFQEDQAKYTSANAAIVGVSADTVDSHVQFCTKENLTFKTLADPEGKVIDQYGSLRGKVAARNTFLIDPQGTVRKVYTNVNANINGHSKEVLADLAALTAKK